MISIIKAKRRRENENIPRLNASNSRSKLLAESPHSIPELFETSTSSPKPLTTKGGLLGNSDLESIDASLIDAEREQYYEENEIQGAYRSLNSRDVPPEKEQKSSTKAEFHISGAVDKCEMPPSKENESMKPNNMEQPSMNASTRNQRNSRCPVQETQSQNQSLLNTQHPKTCPVTGFTIQTAQINMETRNVPFQYQSHHSTTGNSMGPLVDHPESQFSFQQQGHGQPRPPAPDMPITISQTVNSNQPGLFQTPSTLLRRHPQSEQDDTSLRSSHNTAPSGNVFSHQDNPANTLFNQTHRSRGCLTPQASSAVTNNAQPLGAPQTYQQTGQMVPKIGNKEKTQTVPNRRSSILLPPLQTRLAAAIPERRTCSSPPLSLGGLQMQNPFWQSPVNTPTPSEGQVSGRTLPQAGWCAGSRNGQSPIYGPSSPYSEPRVTETGTVTTPQPSPGVRPTNVFNGCTFNGPFVAASNVNRSSIVTGDKVEIHKNEHK